MKVLRESEEVRTKITDYLNNANDNEMSSITLDSYEDLGDTETGHKYKVMYSVTTHNVVGQDEESGDKIYKDTSDYHADEIEIPCEIGECLTEDVDEYEDDIQEINQEFTSANTSINSSKLPAIFKMVSFEPGTINIDYGGGKFDNVADYLTQYDVINLVYDPFNRTAAHNKEVLKTLREAGGADTATCSNVLNVIKEPEVRKNVLQNIARIVKPGGKIYITVYEGTGKGDEKSTSAGYQLNRKTSDYLDEIQEVFPDATRRGKLITATNNSMTESLTEDYSDEEKKHPYVGKKIRVIGGDSNLKGRILTITRAYDDRRGTSVRVDFDNGHQTLTLSPDEYRLVESLDEDWRDGSFTEEDFKKYSDKMISQAHSINDSIQHMIDKYPEYADLFDNLVSEIIEIFSDAYLNESLNLDSEGRRLKKMISQIVTDSDDELRDFVSKIVDEVISEREEISESATQASSVSSGKVDSIDLIVDEDWRDGSFTHDDLDKYLDKINEDAYAIKYSLEKMIDNHPEYNTEILSQIASIRNIFSLMHDNLSEDTVKRGNKWVNVGKSGKTHGEFRTKKQADAQRRAMFANKAKTEKLELNNKLCSNDTELADALIEMINAEWDTINDYNKLYDYMIELGHNQMLAVIADINSEENKHVGQLQECLKQISEVTNDIAKGEDEGAEQLELLEPDPNSDCIEDDCLDCEIVQLDLLDDTLTF